MRIALSVAVALFSGCVMQSQVPIPENQSLSYQKSLRASHHWNLLAADAAAQVGATTGGIGNKPFYVVESAEKSDFNQAFRSLLITQLVQKGATVASNPSGDVVSVSFDAQVIEHRSNRFAYRPGTLMAIAAGLFVLRAAALHGNSDALGAATFGAVAATDAVTASYAGTAPKTEVIVTTSVSYGSRILNRKTDIYYIQEVDTQLFSPRYVQPLPRLKDIRIVGDAK